jgi:hypothetical protein
MKTSPLAKKSKSEVSRVKDRIQALLRQIALLRDGGCVLQDAVPQFPDLPQCNGFTKAGNLILQYDHLNSRGFNVSFADTRLGVILCKGHHGWKHFTDANKKRYDAIMRKLIGAARTKLWDRVEGDQHTYPMTLWDWQKQEIALRAELKSLF